MSPSLRARLHPTPSWTRQRASALLRNLGAGPWELTWHHHPELDARFYQTVLEVSSEVGLSADHRISVSWPDVRRLSQAGLPDVTVEVRILVHQIPALGSWVEGRDQFLVGRVDVSGDDWEPEGLHDLVRDTGLTRWHLDLPVRVDPSLVQRLGALSQVHRRTEASIRIQPLDAWLDAWKRSARPWMPPRTHDLRTHDLSWVVDDEQRAFGSSLLDTPVSEVRSRPEHRDCVGRSERAMLGTCGPCRYYGACSGEVVAQLAQVTDVSEPACWLQDIFQLLDGGSTSTGQPIRTVPFPGKTVRIGCIPSPSVAERIRLSQGTEPPIDDPVRHHVSALVPREPWRRADEVELSHLRLGKSDGWQRDRDVMVLAIDAPAVTQLTSVCRGFPTDSPFRPDEDPRWQPSLQELWHALVRTGVARRPYDAVVCYRSEAGQRTVTRVDREQPFRDVVLGLHVDSWEGGSLRARGEIRNRLCVNLSEAPRSLLIVDRPLTDMLQTLGLGPHDDVRDINLFSAHGFLRRYPTYPVIRVNIAPGEAYIAPTGHLVHDGAAPADQPDYALHFLGDFAPPHP